MNDYKADKKRLISNFLSLSSVEAANYIFPLIALPYLVRVLGPERYGLVAFAQAFMQNFVFLTNYGFNLLATKDIAVYRENKDKTVKIFSAVMTVKAALLTISFAIMAVLILQVPKFRQDWFLYLFAFGAVLGDVLFPVWMFQGLERMKMIAILNMLAKFIFLIAVFVFVRKQADYIFVPLIYSLGFLTAGIISIVVLWRGFGIRYALPKIKDCLRFVKEGWHIFISSTALNYATSYTFILGLLTNNTVVGYYSAAEKLVKSGQRLIFPLTQSIYPYVSKKAAESKEEALSFIRKILPVLGFGSFAVSLAICLLSPYIVNIILGSEYTASVMVLRILAFIPFLVATATVFTYFFLLCFGYAKEWSRIIIVSSFASIILVTLFVHVLKMAQIGAALSWVGTEFLLLVLSYSGYRKYSHEPQVIAR